MNVADGVEEVSAMHCPVCGRPAEEIHAPAFAGRVVRCGHCREFAATDDALRVLAKASPLVRVHTLQQAKRQTVHRHARPVIEAVVAPAERESA